MNRPLSLFEAFGIELEYMIVDSSSLEVRPISDRVIHHVCGSYKNEVEKGGQAWSNELALHVIELKTNGPASSLLGLQDEFLAGIREINGILSEEHARLLGTAMHPWMDPHVDTKLWPHEYNPIYETYNSIFDCRGHGWSNLQSMHINLPFADDREFVALHTAIRAILPLLPALAASSPVADGKYTGFLDYRMHVYRDNSRRIPSITGLLIPEMVNSIQEYHDVILEPMYRDIAPFDKEGILQEEWLNSRGAIARFDRNAIEIRVMDVQECPMADIALAAFVVSILKSLVYEDLSSTQLQAALRQDYLASLFADASQYGSTATIDNNDYLIVFGYDNNRNSQCAIKQLLKWLLKRQVEQDSSLEVFFPVLDLIINSGSLAERVMHFLAGDYRHPHLVDVYGKLSQCLETGELFC